MDRAHLAGDTRTQIATAPHGSHEETGRARCRSHNRAWRRRGGRLGWSGYSDVVRTCHAEPMILDTLDIDADAFAAGTGWEITRKGACKGEVCVPLPDGFSVEHVADRLGMELLRDDAKQLWALGPESLSGRALVTAEAPELVLDDIDGNEFRLSSLRGQKVVLVAWAPY